MSRFLFPNLQVGIGEGVSPSAATDLIARQDIEYAVNMLLNSFSS